MINFQISCFERGVALSTLIDDLLLPDNLPDPTGSVDLVQTHISLVFVADKFVYKIKKPVDFGFLDFSTLEKRRYYCEKEIELNSRLAQNIYLDLLPVIFDGKCHRIVDRQMVNSGGRVVEYCVKMRRIPEEGLMKNLFHRGELRSSHLRQLAKVLARFHRHAKRGPEIDQFGLPEKFKVNTDENFSQVQPYVGLTIDKAAFEAIREWTEAFYSNYGNIFLERIKQGRVRDGHGDLHMEHICFEGDKISIFDCIEFNDRFRYADQLADISFLLMDLEFHGGDEQAEFFWDSYKTEASEGNVERLLTFYKVYRAFVRGKVNSFQLDDPGISHEKKQQAVSTARKYFDLALKYVKQ